MAKNEFQTSYKAILVLAELLEDPDIRHQVEGSVLLYVPMLYREAKSIEEQTLFNTIEEESYVNGMSRKFREEFERLKKIMDQKTPLEDRVMIIQRVTVENYSELVDVSHSAPDALLYPRKRTGIEDPYVYSLMIARNASQNQLLNIARTLGSEVEDNLKIAYAARALSSMQGRDDIERALKAEYSAFTAILREYIRHRGK